MKTLAAIAFITGVAALGIQLARTPTVASGRVLEADLLAQLREHGVTGMACDPEVPIGRDGASFVCVATLDDGATQTVAYTMNRAGSLTAKRMSSTGATHQPSRIPPSADPWAN
jgi:hypothetical protein